jgi:predicted DNA-binding transcriptional regulator AlpA
MVPQATPGAFHFPSTSPPNRVDQMSPHMRVLSFSELKRLKHIGWNEAYIAQLVSACLFPAPIHPRTWRESHIDDWIKARRAKGDLSWMHFSLKRGIGSR